MAKHTPGPWYYMHHKGLNEHLVGVTLRNVAIVEHRHEDAGECPPGTTEANARLIAAAPELLTSLIEFVEWPHGKVDPAAVMGRAGAAIRKATEE